MRKGNGTPIIAALSVGLSAFLALACGGDGSNGQAKGGESNSAGGSSSGSGGSGVSGGGKSSSQGGTSQAPRGGGTAAGGTANGTGGTGTVAGTSSGGTNGGRPSTIPMVPGEVDPNSPATKLPALPRIPAVRGTAVGDSVSISFEPIDEALDYRVYELPADGDITAESDGSVTVKNALYRCAGNRQAPAATLDGATQVQSGAIRTLVDGQKINDYTRKLEEATLGYVYVEPGAGRVPVYALGDNHAKADNSCYFQRWQESRVKQYVTSEETRETLLKAGSRDDGIVFYVPEKAGADTVQIRTQSAGGDWGYRLYYADGPEADFRKEGTAAFLALKEQAKDSRPLMRVMYGNACGYSHDELVAGKARFERARRQGDKLPLFNLHWAGLKKQTTLVVEALDARCPYRGFLSGKSSPSYNASVGNVAYTYEPWETPEELAGKDDAGEVFINGQADSKVKPRPIARSFLKISPAAAPELDWSYGFKADDTLPGFKDIKCGAPDGNCFGQYRQQGASGEFEFFAVEDKRWSAVSMLGELWVTYSDIASDTNGKFRLTPSAAAETVADSFLYVSMETNAFTTARRYPQIMISDRMAPVQQYLTQGKTLIFQTFANWPNVYELQICDHKYWDVNDQCPRFDFYSYRDPNDDGKVIGLAPTAELGDAVGMDRQTRFEVYVSTKRAYLYLDGKPYGCANLPDAKIPKGKVSVTFGDVMYHSDADLLFEFTERHYRRDTQRHFDNLGYKSHVAAPEWDEARFPCVSNLYE